MFRLGLRARAASPDVEIRARLKARIADLLALAPGDVVSVTELSCSAAGCPDKEIVVAILREGRSAQAAKFHVAMDLISDEALRDAFATAPEGQGGASP